jgi:hypothetical protein
MVAGIHNKGGGSVKNNHPNSRISVRHAEYFYEVLS